MVTAVGTVSGLDVPDGTVSGLGVADPMTITTHVGFTAGDTKRLVLVDPFQLALSNKSLDHVTQGVLTISWQLILADGRTISAGTSENRFYVTWKAPNVPAAFGPKPLYETVLKTGCVYNNEGAPDTTDSVLAHAFAPFRALKVLRAGYAPTDPNAYLKYYGTYTTTNDRTDLLLNSGDGTCVGWSKFLVDVREAQGIHQQDWFHPVLATTDIGRIPVPNPFNPNLTRQAYQPTDILVKKWTWNAAQPTFTLPQDPSLGNLQGKKFFLNTFPLETGVSGAPNLGPNSYAWKLSQVIQAQNDPLNFPGEGVRNPQSRFTKHNVVLIDGELYDPSYGRVWADLKSFRANALDGFAYVFPNFPLDANNQYDPTGTPQNIVAFYPAGADQPAITLFRPTTGPSADFNDY